MNARYKAPLAVVAVVLGVAALVALLFFVSWWFDAPPAAPDVETVDHVPPPASHAAPRSDGGAWRPHPDRAGLRAAPL